MKRLFILFALLLSFVFIMACAQITGYNPGGVLGGGSTGYGGYGSYGGGCGVYSVGGIDGNWQCDNDDDYELFTFDEQGNFELISHLSNQTQNYSGEYRIYDKELVLNIDNSLYVLAITVTKNEMSLTHGSEVSVFVKIDKAASR